MGKRIRSIPMVFAKQKFLTDIEAARFEMNLTINDIEELAGYYGLGNFMRRPIPNIEMVKFLAVCNLLDLDPRNYFELQS